MAAEISPTLDKRLDLKILAALRIHLVEACDRLARFSCQHSCDDKVHLTIAVEVLKRQPLITGDGLLRHFERMGQSLNLLPSWLTTI